MSNWSIDRRGVARLPMWKGIDVITSRRDIPFLVLMLGEHKNFIQALLTSIYCMPVNTPHSHVFLVAGWLCLEAWGDREYGGRSAADIYVV